MKQSSDDKNNDGPASDEAFLAKLKGKTLFFFHPSRAWELATMISWRRDPRQGLTAQLRLEVDGELIEAPVRASSLYLHTPGVEQHDPDNLLVLSELHHSLLLNVLRIRHAKDLCYTYLGDLVIAVNPFKYTIPWYQDSEMVKYSAFYKSPEIPSSTEPFSGPYTQFLHPNTWAVAHRAYIEMMSAIDDGSGAQRNHSIVISGESGAGKTETCKLLLRYLVHIARETGRRRELEVNDKPIEKEIMFGSFRSLVGSNPGNEPSSQYASPNASPAGSFCFRPGEDVHKREEVAALISQKVQQSNPILEAFGNAKTSRNDNSSRFGKFMEIQFSDDGSLVGMRVTPFLLEKSRVTHCGPDERTYHCFYQLIAGAPADLRSLLRLRAPKDYIGLNRGGCVQIRGVDDATEFSVLVKAMEDIGIDSKQQEAVWRVLAAILHLQNLDFDEHRVTSHAELSDLAKADVMFIASDLLQMPHPARLAECLVTHITFVKSERLAKALSVQRARDQRDSICKHLYAKLFSWLVERINDATQACVRTTAWIGLLDIFGFEDMQFNSFEQLCINLANETLQRHYSRAIFQKDMELMRAEGIKAENVSFRDNAACIELLQGVRNSVLSFLDDASTLDLERAQTNPNMLFLARLTEQHRPDYQTAPGQKGSKSVLDRDSSLVTPSDFFLRGRLDDDSFTIRHYAGDVKYRVAGFVEKNTDTLKESTLLTLMDTADDIFSDIMNTDEDNIGLLSNFNRSSSPRRRIGGPGSPVSNSATGEGFSIGGSTKTTAAATFRKSLAMLKEMLDSSATHWVRCLRPHPRKQPGLFDNKSVLEQLIATGVLETIAQRQRNFPFRIPHREFLDRFGAITKGSGRGLASRLSMADRCLAILVKSGLGNDPQCQVGHSRVFLGTEQRQWLEERRITTLEAHVTTLTRFVLMRLSREFVCGLNWNRKAIIIQQRWHLVLRIKRMVESYYADLRKKMLEQQAAARRELYILETKQRLVIQGRQEAKRLEIASVFKRQLLPLIDGVLANIQIIEQRRRLIIEQERDEWEPMISSLMANDHVESEARHQRRLAAEAEARREARIYLESVWANGASNIIREESNARSSLTTFLQEPLERLNRAAADVARQMAARDRILESLERERTKELDRLANERERQIEQEESLWVHHVGSRQYALDLAEIISKNNMSYQQACRYLRTFYKLHGPSSILHAKDSFPLQADHNHQQAAAPETFVTRGLQNVSSFSDYASHWVNAFKHYKSMAPNDIKDAHAGMQAQQNSYQNVKQEPVADEENNSNDDFDEFALLAQLNCTNKTKQVKAASRAKLVSNVRNTGSAVIEDVRPTNGRATKPSVKAVCGGFTPSLIWNASSTGQDRRTSSARIKQAKKAPSSIFATPSETYDTLWKAYK